MEVYEVQDRAETCDKGVGDALSIRELQYDISVSTPAAGVVSTSLVCAKCVAIVERHKSKSN